MPGRLPYPAAPMAPQAPGAAPSMDELMELLGQTKEDRLLKARADALGQPLQQRHTTPTGALFGGLANIVRALKARGARGDIEEQQKQAGSARQQLMSAALRGSQPAPILDATGEWNDFPTPEKQRTAMMTGLIAGRPVNEMLASSEDPQLQRFGTLQLGRIGTEEDRLRREGETAETRAFTAEQNRLRLAQDQARLDFDKERAKSEAEARTKEKSDKAAADAAKAAADRLADQLKLTGDMRKEFNQLPQVKEFAQVQVSYEKMKSAAAQPSGAGDIALIFGYMKMLDPASSVREGEAATAENAGGIPSQVANLYNKVMRGERLPDSVRADFMRQAGGFYQTHAQQVTPLIERYQGLAGKAGISPEDVAAPIGRKATGKPGDKSKPTGDFELTDKVTMRAPDGKTYSVDMSEVHEALANGWVKL